MNTKTIQTEKGNISKVVLDDGERLDTYAELFDAIMSAPTDTVAIDRADITDEFFQLRSGLAGDVLQKVSNYRKRFIVLGDFAAVESGSLKSFIIESNRGGKVLFVPSIEDAVKLLR